MQQALQSGNALHVQALLETASDFLSSQYGQRAHEYMREGGGASGGGVGGGGFADVSSVMSLDSATERVLFERSST
jgi:hypothetical protein